MTGKIDLGSNPVCAEFTNISLHEEEKKKKKQPRRILHFSDGILEEYSTDEEEENTQPVVDPKTLDWMPWVWYCIVTVSKKSLSVADTCGEHLAWFFGITTPKYQYAIDEYYRLKEEEEKEKQYEERRRQKIEEEKLSHIEVESDNSSKEQVKEPNIPTCDIKSDDEIERPSVHSQKYQAEYNTIIALH